MLGRYKDVYINKEDFDALVGLGIPYEGFVIGVGYAYLLYDVLEPVQFEHMNSSVLSYNNFCVQFATQCIDNSREAFTLSLGMCQQDLISPIEQVLGSDEGYLIIISQCGEVLRKIKKEGKNIYIKVNRQAFDAIISKFSDTSDYYALLTLGALRNKERHTGYQTLIAEPQAYAIKITGEMREGNSLLGDVTIAFVLNFDDGTSIVLDSFKGVAGGYGNGAPENGDYVTSNYADRGPLSNWYNRGMTHDEIGFSFNLDPQFKTNRSLLRIHPDGNNEGTLGCIGLSGDKNDLIRFRDKLRGYLKLQKGIPTKIYIMNNPNNDNWGRKKTPNINE